MKHNAPRSIVIVDCAMHASCITDDAIRCTLLQQRSLLGLLDQFPWGGCK